MSRREPELKTDREIDATSKDVTDDQTMDDQIASGSLGGRSIDCICRLE
jgi:hypothetical protein